MGSHNQSKGPVLPSPPVEIPFAKLNQQYMSDLTSLVGDVKKGIKEQHDSMPNDNTVRVEHETKLLNHQLDKLLKEVQGIIDDLNHEKLLQNSNFEQALERIPEEDVLKKVQDKLSSENVNLYAQLKNLQKNNSQKLGSILSRQNLPEEHAKKLDELDQAHINKVFAYCKKEEAALFTGQDYEKNQEILLTYYRRLAVYQWVQHLLQTKTQFKYSSWSPSEYSLQDGKKRKRAHQGDKDVTPAIIEDQNPFWMENQFHIKASNNYTGKYIGEFNIEFSVTQRGKVLTAVGGERDKHAFAERARYLIREAFARGFNSPDITGVGKFIQDNKMRIFVIKETYLEGRRIGYKHEQIRCEGISLDKFREEGNQLSKDFDNEIFRKLESKQKEKLFEIIDDAGLDNYQTHFIPRRFVRMSQKVQLKEFPKASAKQQAAILTNAKLNDETFAKLFKSLAASRQAKVLNYCEADTQIRLLTKLEQDKQFGIFNRMDLVSRIRIYPKLGLSSQVDFLKRSSKADGAEYLASRKSVINNSDLLNVLLEICKDSSNENNQALTISSTNKKFITDVFSKLTPSQQFYIKEQLGVRFNGYPNWLTAEISDINKDNYFKFISSLSTDQQYQYLFTCQLIPSNEQSNYFQSLSMVNQITLMSKFARANDEPMVILEKLNELGAYDDPVEILKMRILLKLANKYFQLDYKDKYEFLASGFNTLFDKYGIENELEAEDGSLHFKALVQTANDELVVWNNFKMLAYRLFEADNEMDQTSLIVHLLNRQPSTPDIETFIAKLLKPMGDKLPKGIFNKGMSNNLILKILKQANNHPKHQAILFDNLLELNIGGAVQAYLGLPHNEKANILLNSKNATLLIKSISNNVQRKINIVFHGKTLSHISKPDKLYGILHNSEMSPESRISLLKYDSLSKQKHASFALRATYLCSTKLENKKETFMSKGFAKDKRKVYDYINDYVICKDKDAILDTLFTAFSLELRCKLINYPMAAVRRADLVESADVEDMYELLFSIGKKSEIANELERQNVLEFIYDETKVRIVENFDWEDEKATDHFIELLHSEKATDRILGLFNKLDGDKKQLIRDKIDSEDSLNPILNPSEKLDLNNKP